MGFRRMLGTIWMLAGIGIMAVPLLAQNFVDPQDHVYQDLDNWSRRRLIPPQPLLRPYTLQMIIPLLEKILEMPESSTDDKQRAQHYLDRLGSGIHPGFKLQLRAADDSSDVYFHGDMHIEAAFEPFEWLTTGLEADVYGIRKDGGYLLPEYTGVREDYFEDWSSAGEFLIRQMYHTEVGIGLEGGVIQGFAGYTRQSWGPFFDNGIVAGPQAPSSGRFSLVLTQPGYDVTMALFELAASTDQGKKVNGANYAANKHLTFHSIEGHLADWLDLGMFETILCGSEYNPLYLIPYCTYFQMQGVGGFTGNYLMGFDATVKPTAGLDLSGVVYIDDLHFNDIVKLDFNTKWKLAGQIGAQWAPVQADLAAIIRWVALDCTAVMPYMYTHWDGDNDDTVNYTNYTHKAVNFGPDLDPNSLRLNAAGKFTLFSDPSWGRLDMDLKELLVFHGNASAGIYDSNGSATEVADGGLFDPGYTSGGKPTFQSPYSDLTGFPATRFLVQDVIEKTFQSAVDFHYILNKLGTGNPSLGELGFDIGYTFEYKWNADLIQGNAASQHYVRMGMTWTY